MSDPRRSVAFDRIADPCDETRGGTERGDCYPTRAGTDIGHTPTS